MATFDPGQIKPWEDTRTGANSPWAPIWSPPEIPKDGVISAKVTFSQPGTYTLVGWHERVGEQATRVTVTSGRQTTMNLSLPVGDVR